MLLFRKPSRDLIDAFLDTQSQYGFNYPEVGATAGTIPEGYVVDHTRVRIGRGEADYRAAHAAMNRWDQLRLGWVDVVAPDRQSRAGDMVAIIARFGTVRWLNACRVVYIIDDADARLHRIGVAYGTLPDHAAVGEERFLVEWDRTNDEVYYDVLAFSRPNLRIARYGYYFMRKVQRYFGKVSAARMVRLVDDSRK